MMPIVRKLTRYAAYAGHTSRSARIRSGESGGTRSSRTSNVAAIATTPSLKASSRLVRTRPLCALLSRRVDVDISGWHDFYVMAGGAAAALTRLVVVALSLCAEAIMAHPLFRDRAFAAIIALMTQVFLSGAVLMPSQPS